MLRRIAIALGAVAALTASGVALQWLLFGPAEPPQTRAPTETAAAAPPKSPQPPATPPPPPQARVIDVDGAVERRDGESADWRAMRPGELLPIETEVRTGDDGQARLELGAGTEVLLDGDSQVELAEVNRSLSRVRLQEGRVRARVARGQTGRLRIEVEGSEAVAEATDADFAVLRSAPGEVAVATERGAVALSAAEQTVEVGAGEQSLVVGDGRPSTPERIPASLFLKLTRSMPRRLRARTATVAGKTLPGAQVTIGAQRVAADADGNFESVVALSEGRNELTVSARDVLGRTERKPLPPITVDTKPPKVQGEVVW